MGPLSSSYGCCQLRTGCIILGYLEIATFVMALIVVGVVGATYFTDKPPDDNIQKSAIILLLSTVTCLISGITLLVGAYTERPGCVMVHLIIDIITLILGVVAVFLPITTTPWHYTLMACILLLWSLYHWLISLSYFNEIR